ncbi:MAG: choice-of-anchor D domain-containing protein [Deltaproteobacteria bacterium]
MNKLRFLLPFALFAGVLSGCSDDPTVVFSPPEIELDPSTLDFGPVQVGTRIERKVAIKNVGDSPLTIDSVDRGEPFLDDVYSYDVSVTAIAPNQSAFVTIVFEPEDEAEYLSQLVIKSDLDDAIIQIRGEGVATTLEITPPDLSFGNVVVNTTKSLPITVRNTSMIDVTIGYGGENNVRLCRDAANAGETFCLSFRDALNPDGRFLLPAGAQTVIDVEFTPVIAGTRERGQFVLSGCNSSVCDQEIDLDGLGVESGFRCTPDTLDFGQVNPGSCLTRTVSCENIANEQITIINWATVTNGNMPSSPDFTVEPSSVLVLNEGETLDVDATYCPETLGDDTGTLRIETNNPNPSARDVFVPLVGTGGGPDIEVIPLEINFGLVSTLAPARRSVLILNAGFDTLDITGFVEDVAQTGAFSAPTATQVSLEQGESITIPIEFLPTQEGLFESGFTIQSNDADEPEVTVDLTGEGIVLPPCNFVAAPTTMSFGVVEATRSIRRAFEIQNVGADQCLVTSAEMTPGSDMAFSLPDGEVTSQLIEPGATLTVNVEFAPQQSGTYVGGVEFSISDPNNPFNTIDLSGTGADATLLIVPNDLDFGTIGVDCAARARLVTMYNTGSTPATITSIAMAAPANAAFRIVSQPAPLPGANLVLQPGASAEFSVGFQAGSSESSYAGAVEIAGSFNGAQVTYIVSLLGRSAKDATQIDEFEQLGTPKVDIMFVIDNSCSMSQEQDAIATNFQAFIQFAQAQALDYQLAVTTTDVTTSGENGRFVPVTGNAANRIVTPQTQPTPEAVFADNVSQGTSGSASELGFEAAYRALTAPNIVGHNAGFLRQDAVLSIIFVSDEPEQSQNTADFYINFFLSIKGFRNSNLFSASSIVGDNPGGCNGAGGSASAAPRYIEAANRTGGVFQSICTADWSRSLEDLSTAAFGFKSRFFLTNQPVISTIVVYIDGVSIPGTTMQGTVNWTYDFATNSINFSPFSTPEPGATVRVEYTAECL